MCHNEKNFKKSIDKLKNLCYNIDKIKGKGNNKMFYVETKMGYEEFTTYREAEIYCGTHGIHPENICED